ncbi:hypothetical protein HDV02_005140 [Globomyces sp. JEL0801]|nr:hypothetical protein HDV02_005140 [Globomyces sp. JEL0801]
MLEYTPEYFEPLPFNPITTLFVSIDAIIFNTSMILNATLFYIFIKNYNPNTTSHEKAIALLILCQFCWATPYAVQYVLMLIDGASFSFHQCQYMGPILPIFSALTLLAHSIIALDRYSTICKKSPMSKRCYFWIGLFFVPPVLISAILPLIIGSGYVLNDKYYCFFNFMSTRLEDRLPTFIVFTYLGILIPMIIMCYYRIYRVIPDTFKEWNTKNDTALNALNKKIVRTCVIVLSALLICYTPVIATYLLQAIFQYQLPDGINHAISTISIFDTLLSPLILIHLIPLYNHGIKKILFGSRLDRKPDYALNYITKSSNY